MNRDIFELSRRIVAEQRYLALKDSPKFQQKTGTTSTQGARYIERLIFLTYAVTAVSMLAFSSFLTLTQIRLPDPLAHLQTLSLLLYAYIFLISLYSFIMFTNIVRTYRLFEPLKPLPTDIGHMVLPISWFVFTGSSSLFVIVPLIAAYVWVTGNLLPAFTGVLWAFLMLALGYTAGSAMIFTLSGSMEKRPGMRSGSLSSILRVAGFLAFFVLFEIAIQIPQEIPVLPPLVMHPLYMAIPLLGIAYTVFGGPLPSFLVGYDIFMTSAYTAAIVILFLVVNRRTFNRITKSDASTFSKANISVKKLHESSSGFYITLLRKDLRNIFRKSQNFLMMLIPIFLVLPTLLSLFFYSSGISFGSISIYYSMLAIVIVSSAFYSLVLMISEGSGISVLQALPLRMRDIIYSKEYVGAIVFAFIVIPVSVLFLFRTDGNPIIFLLFPVNLIIAYVYTSLFNIRRLMLKIPKGSTTLNFYSFGGNVELVILFSITAVLTALPTIVSTVLSYIVVRIPYSHPMSFYLSTLAINLFSLLVIMGIINRTP
ncbi:MAG: hypothetical protein M1431_04275 [Candidatus Thermoplasmatota archaeon]|nr:hypothetical protein [Candidatus Thermoplasmatota archaeon]